MSSNANSAASKFKYNGKELNEELGLDWYDFGARNYDAALGRWMNIDPLAEIYSTDTPFAYVLNNPLSFIDPDGRQVVGVSKKDAEKVHNGINTVFADERFDKVRSLFTRGKKNNKKKFDKISAKDAAEALSGLQGDDLALAEMLIGVINTEDVHMVEYTEKDEDLSQTGSNAIANDPGFKSRGTKKKENGRISSNLVIAYAGGTQLDGVNVATEDGSYTMLGSSARPWTLFHEVLGHGIPNAKQITGKTNMENAIRTENLVLRVLGKDTSQRSGRDGHGGPFENYKALPAIKY